MFLLKPPFFSVHLKFRGYFCSHSRFSQFQSYFWSTIFQLRPAIVCPWVRRSYHNQFSRFDAYCMTDRQTKFYIDFFWGGIKIWRNIYFDIRVKLLMFIILTVNDQVRTFESLHMHFKNFRSSLQSHPLWETLYIMFNQGCNRYTCG